jgi:hypothetical protein
MRNVLDTSCIENQNTLFMFNIFFFFPPRKLCPLRDNVEEYDGARAATNDVKIWRIGFACWVNKVTYIYAHAQVHALGHAHSRSHKHAHTQVMLVAFPRQRLLLESVSVLRYKSIACLCIFSGRADFVSRWCVLYCVLWREWHLSMCFLCAV